MRRWRRWFAPRPRTSRPFDRSGLPSASRPPSEGSWYCPLSKRPDIFAYNLCVLLRVRRALIAKLRALIAKLRTFDGFCEGDHGGVVDVGVGFVGEEGIEGSERDSEASSHC